MRINASSIFSFIIVILFSACTQTVVIESPKTAYVPEVGDPKDPQIIWTSRVFPQGYEYLGQVKVRSWTYDGAVERLKEGGKQVRADAIIDIHYENIGFLTSLHGFAIKYNK